MDAGNEIHPFLCEGREVCLLGLLVSEDLVVLFCKSGGHGLGLTVSLPHLGELLLVHAPGDLVHLLDLGHELRPDVLQHAREHLGPSYNGATDVDEGAAQVAEFVAERPHLLVDKVVGGFSGANALLQRPDLLLEGRHDLLDLLDGAHQVLGQMRELGNVGAVVCSEVGGRGIYEANEAHLARLVFATIWPAESADVSNKFCVCIREIKCFHGGGGGIEFGLAIHPMMKAVLVGLLVLATLCVCRNPYDANRVLLLVGDGSIASGMKTLVQEMEGRGYNVDLRLAMDGTVPFKEYGEFEYDHVAIFVKEALAAGTGLTADKLLDFVDAGGNLMISSQGALGGMLSEVAVETGVRYPGKGKRDSLIRDFSNTVNGLDDGSHTSIWAKLNVAKPVSQVEGVVAYRGVSLQLGGENNLLKPMIVAQKEAVHPKAERLTKEEMVLVAGLQALNNARMVFAGSVDLFTDTYLQASGNSQQAIVDVLLWLVGERGALRAREVRHNLQGRAEEGSSKQYTINEAIHFEMKVEQWTGEVWVGYAAQDIQLSLEMIDPYVRVNLEPQGGSAGVHSKDFTLPDVYGVFTFRVLYNRPGYSRIDVIDRVPIRPLRHNEYERFIPAAYPYYASSFSMLVGTVIIFLFFTFHK